VKRWGKKKKKWSHTKPRRHKNPIFKHEERVVKKEKLKESATILFYMRPEVR